MDILDTEGSTPMRIQLRKVAASLLAFAALLGGATVGVAQATDGGHAHAAKHHKKKHHHHKSKIPQHNSGDHDSDNNGGPSDGDGNI
jgi:Spy/CpxP family protein refolding chaperone